MKACAFSFQDFAPLLFGTCCLVCGSPAVACCPACRERIIGKAPHQVRRCGLSVPTWAANPYRPELARLIPAFKDDGAWSLVRLLSCRLAMAVVACRPPTGTVLVPVPSQPAAVRRRGIDHTWMLARRVARALGIEAARLLRRLNGGDAQRLQGRAGRERLSESRFLGTTCRSPVIVIDDVVTTGTSLTVSCEAMRRCGATVIAAAVIGDANLSRKY